MRKFLILFICILFLLSGCSDNLIPLDSKYNISYLQDYIVDEESSLGFRYIYNKEEDAHGYLLGFLNNIDVEIDEDSGYLRTLIVGKECISITGIVLDLHVKVTDTVILDVLNRFYMGVNSDIESVILEYHKEGPCPYIISQNSDSYSIDYVTTCSNNSEAVVYYRINIRDVYSIEPYLTDEQYEILPSYLNLLLDCLGIDFVFVWGEK